MLLALPILIFISLTSRVVNGTNRVAIVIQTALTTVGFKSKGITPFISNQGISALTVAIIGAQIAIAVNCDTLIE